jgi:hypothetical protein
MGNKRWLLLLGILVGGVICLSSSYAAPDSLPETARSLEQGLDQLERLLVEIEQNLAVQQAVSPQLGELAATMDRLHRLVQQIGAEVASFEEDIPRLLPDGELQELARRRQAEAKANLEQRWAELTGLVDRLGQLSRFPNGERSAVVGDCRRALRQLIARQHKPLDVASLPLKGVSWEDNSPPKISPPTLSGLPTAEDLAPTPTASFTPSIIQLADALDRDPLKIYRWVKNNIHYLPLFGSIKGAQRCLGDREGSDFDQASLLIALLRAAKVPARYVYGRMRLPADAAAEWLGVERPGVAATVLRRGGIPYQDEVIQRVWVKAYVDGAWLEMDPAFKRCVWEDTAVDEGLSWVGLPAGEREQLETALGVSLLTSGSLANGQRKLVIEPESDRPPVGNPSSVIAREWEATKIPAEFRYGLKVELGPARGGASSSSVELSLAEVLTQPLSLLYLPADKLEAEIMDALMLQLEDKADPDRKKITHLPSYLVKVRPHLLLGDRIIARGEPVCLGTPQYLTLSFKAPLQPIAPLRHLVIAGTQASLGLNMGSMSLESLNDLNGDAAAAGGLTRRLRRYVAELWNKELGLGVFKYTALAYHQQNGRLARVLAQHNGVYAVPFMGEALLTRSAVVNYAFDIPISFYYSGISFDLQRNSFVLTPKGDNPAAGRRFLAQAGVYGAMLEHRVLEQVEDKRFIDGKAVSAVKALLLAQAQGIPLFRLTGKNGSQIWPQLKVNQAILQDIKAAAAQGYEVILPQQEISLNDWQGLGYIVRQPATGSGAYLISGGLAGSFGGGATATTTIRGGLPRSTWGKIVVIVLILAVVIIVAAM